jgi:predicted small secreted protein
MNIRMLILISIVCFMTACNTTAGLVTGAGKDLQNLGGLIPTK